MTKFTNKNYHERLCVIVVVTVENSFWFLSALSAECRPNQVSSQDSSMDLSVRLDLKRVSAISDVISFPIRAKPNAKSFLFHPLRIFDALLVAKA